MRSVPRRFFPLVVLVVHAPAVGQKLLVLEHDPGARNQLATQEIVPLVVDRRAGDPHALVRLVLLGLPHLGAQAGLVVDLFIVAAQHGGVVPPVQPVLLHRAHQGGQSRAGPLHQRGLAQQEEAAQRAAGEQRGTQHAGFLALRQLRGAPGQPGQGKEEHQAARTMSAPWSGQFPKPDHMATHWSTESAVQNDHRIISVLMVSSALTRPLRAPIA
jgi:hypothetical protein